MDERRRLRISTAHQRRAAAARWLLDCGHTALQVSLGRCWECHLAHLRATGQGARADRLEVLKRQRDEGSLDYSRLIDGLVAAFEARHEGEDPIPPAPKITGVYRCFVPRTYT